MPRLHPALLLAASLLGGLLNVPLAAAQSSETAPTRPAEAVEPSALDAELFYQLLIAEMQRRADPGAAYSLVLDAAKRTRHPDLYRRAVEIALQGRAGNAALGAARDWSTALPADEEARRTELQLLLGLQRVRETGPVLRDWIRAAPAQRRPAIIALVPTVLARTADPAEAVATARVALNDWLRPPETAAAAWSALGRVQRQAGQAGEALQSARAALQADARSGAAAQLALELFEAEPQTAEPLIQRYLQATADAADAGVRASYARALAQNGRLAEARGVLQQPPARDADERRRLRMAEARLLRDHDHPQAAYDLVATLLQETPDDADLMYEKAMVAERLGRLEEMERLLRTLIARQPEEPHAYNALGYALADRGERLPEAKALIQEALRRAPDDAYIIDSLGWVEFRLGNLPEARRLLANAMQRKPDAEIAAHLGEVLWVLGERDEARAIWRQGLELDRRNRTLTETLKRLGTTP